MVVGVPSAVFTTAGCALSEYGDGCGAVAALAVAGVGVGALLGAAIGSAASRWQLRYASSQVALKFSPQPTQRLGVGLSMRLPAVRR